MKQLLYPLIAAASIIMVTACASPDNDSLVILHTNDTHSHIDPDPETGDGGVLRRKAAIDSIRESQPNVLLVDAGDAVQGSLYYSFYHGKVEAMAMNAMGYDVALLGNHEFDNGIDALINQYHELKASKISTNYEFDNASLDSMFTTYLVKEYNNKRIGIIGLNINPSGLISPRKCVGVKYHDFIEKANYTATRLKNEMSVDFIIALTHIGYSGDTLLATQSKDINIIIGGHSHDEIDGQNHKKCRFLNLANEEVLVAQTGGNGHSLGEIKLNLKNGKAELSLIRLNDKFDRTHDSDLAAALTPYKHVIDSFHAIKVTQSIAKLDRKEEPLINFISDFIHSQAEILTGKKIDIALMNRGGIRNNLPKGVISKGDLMMAFPFDNFITVIEIKGDSLNKAIDRIISDNKLSLSNNSTAIFSNDKTYRLASINYITEGGDDMSPLTAGKVVASSHNDIKDDLLDYFNKPENKDYTIIPDTTDRVLRIKLSRLNK